MNQYQHQNQTPTVQDHPLTAKTLDALTCAGSALERLEKIHHEKKASDARVARVLPAAARELIAAGLIDENENEELGRVLADHERTVELVRKFAAHYRAQFSGPDQGEETDQSSNKMASADQSQTIGKPVGHGGSSNGHRKQADPYVGNRSSRLSPADQAYYKMVLGYVPGDDEQ